VGSKGGGTASFDTTGGRRAESPVSSGRERPGGREVGKRAREVFYPNAPKPKMKEARLDSLKTGGELKEGDDSGMTDEEPKRGHKHGWLKKISPEPQPPEEN